MIDNKNKYCGLRLGIDRRQFSYTFHLPERRSAGDRRGVMERRQENMTKRK